MRGGQGGWRSEWGVARCEANGTRGGGIAEAVIKRLSDGREAAAASLVEVRARQQRVPARYAATGRAGNCKSRKKKHCLEKIKLPRK